MKLPLGELREAVYQRLVADIAGGTARVFTVAAWETPRPYLELDEMRADIDGTKTTLAWTCHLTIRAWGDEPNAADVHGLIDGAINALHRSDVVLANEFRVEETWLASPVLVSKFFDNERGFRWVASVTMRFRVLDTRTYTQL